MTQPHVHFLLTPDKSCSRRLRRLLAEQSPRMGVLTGTWSELVQQASDAYLIPPVTADWNNRFHTALGSLPEAFWYRSFTVSPAETAAEVQAALTLLVSATEIKGSDGGNGITGADSDSAKDSTTGSKPNAHTAVKDEIEQTITSSARDAEERAAVIPPLEHLSGRPARRVEDIRRLLQALDGCLPAGLQAIQRLIRTAPNRAVRNLVVINVEDFPPLTQWQQTLVDKLNQDAGAAPKPELLEQLQALSRGADSVGRDRRASHTNGDGEADISTCPGPDTAVSALAFMQQHLFSSGLADGQQGPQTDASVQWLGVRDYQEEAEVAAGMAQQILKKIPDAVPSDIGLLVPDSFEYSLAVRDAFTTAGLALSGLPVDHWHRDLGREALFHFLYCRQKPYPAMAMAVCLSSPLMPWSDEKGGAMAQAVMDGNYKLAMPGTASKSDRKMLELLRGGDDNPDSLAAAIQSFVNLLDGDESCLNQAQAMAATLVDTLQTQSTLEWGILRRLSAPRHSSTEGMTEFTREGITVWREEHEPWRPVRYLFVLGFTGRTYSGAESNSSVFVAQDLLAFQKAGLPIINADDQRQLARERFRRQLGAAGECVTFLTPRMNARGENLVPSDWLVFMERLFSNTGHADSVVLELDLDSDREKIRFLPPTYPSEAKPPRKVKAEDIEFDMNLLALHIDREGELKPASPSSLETLMVSRLAWLLGRLGAEPRGWQPESPNPAVMGTLTHAVFEDLFKAGLPVPDAKHIKASTGKLLESKISEIAPYLRAARWQVEQKQLVRSIEDAALTWGRMLLDLGADILATEIHLHGWLCLSENQTKVPIHGYADCLLGLPDGALLLVDYKKAKSDGRLGRMERGFDSQLDLYRIMLQTGGPSDSENTLLQERLDGAKNIGVLYFMANDHTALNTYAEFVQGIDIPGWVPVSGSSVSLFPLSTRNKDLWEERLQGLAGNVSALALIRLRLEQVQQGRLVLNREWEEEFFRKFGRVTPYAMNVSPLIKRFSTNDEGLWKA